MAVKIRLQRKGRKQAPFYHIVVADSRSPRDGRFIEKIGTYNPLTRPATIDIDRDSAFNWVMNGAQPTDTARAILRFKGVYYRKHLAVGVAKGAITQEDADKRYLAWVEAKEGRIAARAAKTAEEKAAFYAMVSGQPKPKAAPAPVVVEPVAEVAEEATEVAEEVVEAVVETTEEAAVEATETNTDAEQAFKERVPDKSIL
jgi:small subunit ribosomal protein S16